MVCMHTAGFAGLSFHLWTPDENKRESEIGKGDFNPTGRALVPGTLLHPMPGAGALLNSASMDLRQFDST